MAILALILTFAILISAIIVSNNTVSGHRLYRQTPLPTGVPKTFLSLIAVMFAIACVWQFAIDTLDDMRHPAFWISAFGADPILGDVFSTAEQYDMDLGMPTAEFRESDLLMIRNVSRCVATALWCAVAGLAAYAVYMLGLLRENKPTMITCLALLAAALIVGGRASMAGMVHLGDYVASGMGNEYDGDMSDSEMLSFLTTVVVVMACMGLIKGIQKVNSFIEFAENTDANEEEARPCMPPPAPPTPQSPPQATTSHTGGDGQNKVEKLKDIKQLLDAGVLTNEEFEEMKRKIINS